MLLLHPPVSRPSEPPGGLARLAGWLSRQDIPWALADLNIEGQLWLLQRPFEATDTWSRRALRQRDHYLHSLRCPEGYTDLPAYKTAVGGLNRVLQLASGETGGRVSLGDFSHDRLSPHASAHLLQAADECAENVFYPFFSERLAALLTEHSPRWIGLSLNFLSQALTTFAIIGWLRKHSPATGILLGGGLVSSWAGRPGWRNPFTGLVDHLVCGPGEDALGDILRLAATPAGPPHPDFSPFIFAEYLAPGPVLPVSSGDGCYWNRCAFCSERTEGRPYLSFSPGETAAELSHLCLRHRPVLIHLLDSALRPAVLRALAAAPPGADWYGFARLTPELAEPDFCRALRRAGCGMLQLGLESGDQAVLDAMGKGIRLDIAARALTELHRVGIGTYVYLLFGTPWETLAAARRTLDFVVRHHDAIDFVNISVFNRPRGSAELPGLETRDFPGIPGGGDLSLYEDFIHPHGWDRSAVRRFLQEEFRRHPAVTPIVRRTPPVFTSNHAPFLRPAARRA
ncbi:MAG: radical SAM protein [Acidobacteria bacterium]|nr:radical SAM protein [Acidobacteriota bacterium]